MRQILKCPHSTSPRPFPRTCMFPRGNECVRAARIGKWKLHLGHTFRFSSSSLSKIIALQPGHLVQSPSGMSRFFDFFPVASRGFLANAVSADGIGGGVNAGSAVSTPKDFFVNVVVAIDFKLYSTQSPRATVQTQTSPAPARRNSFAQAFVVAPVVKTSSTRMIFSPSNLTPLCTAKAPLILAARCPRVNRVCDIVGSTRRMSLLCNGIFAAALKSAARRAAWLNSRSRSLTGCSGTGTIKLHGCPRKAGQGLAQEQARQKWLEP